MKLQEIMVADVIQISPEEPVAVAARRMREKSVGCIVVTLDGSLKGMITDRDLLGCIAEGHRPSACPVLKHMSRPVVVLKPEEDLSMAARVMRERRIKRLPIVKDRKLLGIVSLSDLAAVAGKEADLVGSALTSLTAVIEAQASQGETGVGPKNVRIRANGTGKADGHAITAVPVKVQAA